MPTDDNPITRLREWVDQKHADTVNGLQLNDAERMFYADLGWAVSRLEAILREPDEVPKPPTFEEFILGGTDGTAMVTTYVFCAKLLNDDGTTGWTWGTPDGTELEQTAGLLWWMNQMTEMEAAVYFRSGGETP